MDANEEHAPQGEGKNVARRRREQQRRALGRKVAWLAGLLQESAAHHTGTKHSPNTGNLTEKEATLERRIIALEQLVGTLVRWQAGGGKVVPGQDEDGGEEMGTQASTRRTLAQGSTLARSWRPASTAESAHVVEGGERKVADVDHPGRQAQAHLPREETHKGVEAAERSDHVDGARPSGEAASRGATVDEDALLAKTARLVKRTLEGASLEEIREALSGHVEEDFTASSKEQARQFLGQYMEARRRLEIQPDSENEHEREENVEREEAASWASSSWSSRGWASTSRWRRSAW